MAQFSTNGKKDADVYNVRAENDNGSKCTDDGIIKPASEMSSQSDKKGLEQQEISKYFVDFSSALLAKRLAKNVW